MLQWILEIGASYIEILLMVCVIIFVGGSKWELKRKKTLLTMGISAIATMIVIICNAIQAFSFITIYINVVVLLILSKWITDSGILLRVLSLVLVNFLFHTLDYILSFTVALIYGNSSNIYEGFLLIMQAGVIRRSLLVASKCILSLLVYLLRNMLRKIKEVSKRIQILLLVLFTVAYIFVSILMNMIVSDSTHILQIAVIISWIFIFISTLAVVYALAVNHRYEREKMQIEIEIATNRLIQKNYLQMSEYVKAANSNIHDFRNHLKVLQQITEENETAQKYTEDILQDLSSKYKICQSGNEYIDAVMNCKLFEIRNQNIQMEYIFQIPEPLSFAGVDICTVLANQIDNAIEACLKMKEKRYISVSVIQKHAFVFFTVENSMQPGSIEETGGWVSHKEDGIRHGYGISNIQGITEKYNGSLSCTVKGNRFISTAMLQLDRNQK